MAIKPAPTTPASKLPSNKILTEEEIQSDGKKEIPKSNEAAVRKIIEAGGKPMPVQDSTVSANDIKPKNINIKFLPSEGDTIDQLRAARPKIRNKKITISLHDWFIEAMQEKIEREKKAFGIK